MRFPVLGGFFFGLLFAVGASATATASERDVDLDGVAAPGATVTATHESGNRTSAVADANGNVRFHNLTSGCWTVTVDQADAQTGSRQICLSDPNQQAGDSEVQLAGEREVGRDGNPFRFSAGFKGSFSNIETNSNFGIGTVVNDGERFGATLGDDLNRTGFKLRGGFRLQDSFLVDGAKSRLFGSIEYAWGTDSDSGVAEVGLGGVSQVALTFLQPDIGGLGTGVASTTAGDQLFSNVGLNNSWGRISLGYKESFYYCGCEELGFKMGIGGAIVYETFDNDFTGESAIVRNGNALAQQSITGNIRDDYLGYSFTGSLHKKFLNDQLGFGVEAYVTPSLRFSERDLSQNTDFSGGLNQSLSDSSTDLTFATGVRLKSSLKLWGMMTARAGYEWSFLGDASETDIPANPSEQSASFSDGSVERHIVSLGLSMKF